VWDTYVPMTRGALLALNTPGPEHIL
jgi:hypothetical protein